MPKFVSNPKDHLGSKDQTLDLSTNGEASRFVPYQMDCGSTCNLTSYAEYCKIAQDGDPELHKSNAKLRLYDGLVMIPMGNFKWLMLIRSLCYQQQHVKYSDC